MTVRQEVGTHETPLTKDPRRRRDDSPCQQEAPSLVVSVGLQQRNPLRLDLRQLREIIQPFDVVPPAEA